MITVGFTYDLRDYYLAQGFSLEESAEFDSQETIQSIEDSLVANGFRVEKIGNIKALVSSLAQGKRWDIVFNICEGVKGIGRESQVPSLLEAYEIPFVFSSSDVIMKTMDKATAKLAIMQKDIPTAPFAVVAKPSDVDSLDLDFPVFIKPLADGTGKGISAKSLVSDQETLKSFCVDLLQRFHQPVLVESYLPGRDFTVGIIGSGSSARVIGVMESHLKEGAEKIGQSYFNKENWKQVLEYVLADDDTAKLAAKYALESWQALGCFDSGRVDLRCDQNGVPHFLEINPIAGLHPTHSDLPILANLSGINHQSLIGLIMEQALSRYDLNIQRRHSDILI